MKNSFLYLIWIILAISGCKTNQPIKYVWKNSYHGGGGYVTGILQHPVNPDILYIRTDVAGVFLSTDGGKNWQPVNQGMTDGYQHCVESFALSLKRPDVLFRCSGEARDHQMVGAIHKSSDGGKTWKLVTDKPDFFGNGDTRYYGEKIAVSPFDSDIVVAASNYRGIWRSTDEGETWSCAGLAKEPLCCIAFDPLHKGWVYTATLDSLPFAGYLYPDGSYKREKVGRLYKSEDNGNNWKLVFEKKGASFTNLVFDRVQSNTLLATFRGDGIYKSTDGGKTFVKKTAKLGNEDFTTLCSDPNVPKVYYTAMSYGPLQPYPVMPLYKSEDGGETWNLIKKEYVLSDFKDFPSYIDRPTMLGWAISKFLVDNKNSNKFYASNWWGIYTSSDACKTWNGNFFRGIENTCLEAIVVDPNDPSRVYETGADGQPCVSRDSGKTFKSLPALISIHLYYCGSAICPSKFKKGFLVYGVSNNAMHTCAIIRAEDDSKLREFCLRLSKGYFVQAIKEDNFNKGVFYAYIEGPVKDSAGLYKSTDWAKSWKKMNLPLPAEIHTLPFRKAFIENELLAVTPYQAKNACGSNRLLMVDPVRPNTIYFGEADKGIFATFDGGLTWQNIGKGLPFGKNVAGVLNVINADPKRKGWLYAGFIHEGLWRSENGGKTWYKLFPSDNQVFNASSVAVGGPSGNEIYVACEPLFWSKASSSIYASYDNGKSWNTIYDTALGSIRWKGIDVDSKTGVLHAISCGNGGFYAKPVYK